MGRKIIDGSLEITDSLIINGKNLYTEVSRNTTSIKNLQNNKQDKISSTPNITVDTSATFVIPIIDTLFTEENSHEAPALFIFNSNLYFMQLNVDSSACLTLSSDKPFSLTTTENLIYDGTLEYFAADVPDWTPVQVGTSIKSINNKIYLRGKGNTYCRHSDTPKDSAYGYSYRSIETACFSLSGSNISCNGNIETLLDWETVKVCNHPTMGNWCFRGLFNRCSALIKAPELPATILSHGCYSNMFSSCQNLTEAPELPALKMAPWCYAGMFAYTSLNVAPIIASTELATGCYNAMFYNCSSLTEAPELPAMKVSGHAYNSMFDECSKLTKAPELPATDLSSSCYMYMFYNCSSLTEAPELPAMKVPSYAYFDMFGSCKKLTKAPELPATDLGNECYGGMFSGCSSLTEAPELPAIYVPYQAYRFIFSGCDLTYFPAIRATTFGISALQSMTGSKLKLSTTPTEECPYEFRLPWGTATATIIHDAAHISSTVDYETPGNYHYPLYGIRVTDTATGKSIPAVLNTTYYASIPTVE